METKIQADFYKYVYKPLISSVDFFAEFPKVQTTLDLAMLCVDSKYSGQGLATRLIHEVVKYAESNKIELVYGLFTSPSSQKAAAKNGFEAFKNVDILNLRDGDGNVIFEKTGSYVVSTMAKFLKSDS